MPLLTEKEVHRLVDPPTQEHNKRHPEERELDAKVDGTGLGKGRRNHSFLSGYVVDDGVCEENDGDDAVSCEGDDGKEDQTEPPGNDVRRARN
jgi:hypothetical protein